PRAERPTNPTEATRKATRPPREPAQDAPQRSLRQRRRHADQARKPRAPSRGPDKPGPDHAQELPRLHQPHAGLLQRQRGIAGGPADPGGASGNAGRQPGVSRRNSRLGEPVSPSSMRPVLVLPEDLVLHLEGHIALSGEPPLYLVSRPSLRARLARRKARAVSGDPEDSAAYRRALGRGRGPLVVAAPAGRAGRVAAAVRAGLPDAAVLVVGDERLHVPGAITVPLSASAARVPEPELER